MKNLWITNSKILWGVFYLLIFIYTSCAPPPGVKRGQSFKIFGKETNLSQSPDSSLTKNPEATVAKAKLSHQDSLNLKLIQDTLATSDSLNSRDTSKSSEKSNKAKKKSDSPLICVADPGTAEGSGTRGSYILEGKVKCEYGRLRFHTRRALWDTQSEEVSCTGGMDVFVDDFSLSSLTGGYRKRDSILWAEQNVTGKDTKAGFEFRAGALNYNRTKRIMWLTKNPELKRISKTIDSTTSKVTSLDTLTLRARDIEYSDSLRYAKARRNVRITRKDMEITADTADFDEASETLNLSGSPKTQYSGNEMKGDRMYIKLAGEELKSVSVKGKAQGFYKKSSSDSGSTAKDVYELSGDSLYMRFQKDNLEKLEIFKEGLAKYFQDSKPEEINQLKGDTIKLNFEGDKIDSAEVFGHASTLYFHYEKNKFAGKNEAKGDTLGLSFQDGKMKEISIRSNASGTYYGAPVSKKKSSEPSGATPTQKSSLVPGGANPKESVSSLGSPALDSLNLKEAKPK